MTDQDLIQAIRQGRTTKALSSLYRHLPMIRKMIRQSGGNRHDAEDIFQETLLILCRRIMSPDFTLTAKLSTYLYSIARFLWNDERKRRQRQPIHGSEESTHFDEALSADLSTISEEKSATLAEKALQEIGERCRELLLRFYIARQSIREITAGMGYGSENAAKTQKYKCLEGAKAKLKQLQTTHLTR